LASGIEIYVTQKLKDAMKDEKVKDEDFWMMETVILKVEPKKIFLGLPEEGDPPISVPAKASCTRNVQKCRRTVQKCSRSVRDALALTNLLDPCILVYLQYLICKLELLELEDRRLAINLLKGMLDELFDD